MTSVRCTQRPRAAVSTVKALRAIVRLRKQEEAILETYMHALGMD